MVAAFKGKQIDEVLQCLVIFRNFYVQVFGFLLADTENLLPSRKQYQPVWPDLVAN